MDPLGLGNFGVNRQELTNNLSPPSFKDDVQEDASTTVVSIFMCDLF